MKQRIQVGVIGDNIRVDSISLGKNKARVTEVGNGKVTQVVCGNGSATGSVVIIGSDSDFIDPNSIYDAVQARSFEDLCIIYQKLDEGGFEARLGGTARKDFLHHMARAKGFRDEKNRKRMATQLACILEDLAIAGKKIQDIISW